MAIVIAEAGKNFITSEKDESVYQEATNLVDFAKEAGADIVKFQTHRFDEIKMRDRSRRKWIERNIRLTPFAEFWLPLKEYCDSVGIEFLSTPMSLNAAKMIDVLVKRWKIGSGNIGDYPLLEFVAGTGKPVILSSGMSTLKELEKGLSIIKTINPNCDLTLLHCVSEYPCPEEHANLSLIQKYKEMFGIRVGYSDHTMSLIIPALAVVHGAEVIEKHFTIDKDYWGPDHKISLDFREFRKMVENVRTAEVSIGTGEKVISQEENRLRKIFRPSEYTVSTNV